jgi:hypothetical protein
VFLLSSCRILPCLLAVVRLSILLLLSFLLLLPALQALHDCGMTKLSLEANQLS